MPLWLIVVSSFAAGVVCTIWFLAALALLWEERQHRLIEKHRLARWDKVPPLDPHMTSRRHDVRTEAWMRELK